MDFNPEPGCAICNILSGGVDDEVVLETNYWRAVLAPDQMYLGRMFLTSRQHVGETEDLGFEAWMELRHVIWRLRGMAVKGLGATHMTHAFLMNNAYAEDPPCPHVHAHVRPRYRDRQIIDGVVFSDSAFGSHHKRGPTGDAGNNRREDAFSSVATLRCEVVFAVDHLGPPRSYF